MIAENALIRMVSAGELAGAGLDVFEHEPAVNPRLARLAREGFLDSDFDLGTGQTAQAKKKAVSRMKKSPDEKIYKTIVENLGKELEELDREYATSFAGQSRLTRDLDLLDKIEINQNYTKSDTLQVMRILKNYDLFRDAQMDLLPDRPGTSRRRS